MQNGRYSVVRTHRWHWWIYKRRWG